MSQVFKVLILVAYREGLGPVSEEEIVNHLREVLTPGGWPGVILGTALKVKELDDPEPALSKFREAAEAEGVDL